MQIREFLFDIAKIVEGATNSDLDKVTSYANQLADRLEAAGEGEGAKRIRNTLAKRNGRAIGVSRAGLRGDASGQLPVDSESRLETADEEVFEKGQVELFVSERQRSEIDQFLTYYRAASRLVANGVGVSPSMIVYGPPGSGKTQLAKFVASELGLPLITARMDALISSYLGSTAKNVRQLFDYAMSRPCILFLDEFDALAKMRDDAKELGELKRVVISLLQNIDAMGEDHALIAATNHEHLLDPAIWRRFTYKLHLSHPDEATRRQLVGKFLGRFSTPAIVDLLTWLGEGMTGAQLRQAIETSIRDAVIGDRESVSVPFIIDRILSMNPEAFDFTGTPEQRIRAMRRIAPKKFTQTKLAEIFGVSQATISRYLKGTN